MPLVVGWPHVVEKRVDRHDVHVIVIVMVVIQNGCCTLLHWIHTFLPIREKLLCGQIGICLWAEECLCQWWSCRKFRFLSKQRIYRQAHWLDWRCTLCAARCCCGCCTACCCCCSLGRWTRCWWGKCGCFLCCWFLYWVWLGWLLNCLYRVVGGRKVVDEFLDVKVPCVQWSIIQTLEEHGRVKLNFVIENFWIFFQVLWISCSYNREEDKKSMKKMFVWTTFMRREQFNFFPTWPYWQCIELLMSVLSHLLSPGQCLMNWTPETLGLVMLPATPQRLLRLFD